MVWFKVDDNLAFHRKAVAAGNGAMGLWVRAGSWCGQQLTDGFVPDHIAHAIGKKSEAQRLVTAGLWLRVEGGYQFWQWDEPGRQPTREQVEADRAAARERMRRVRDGSRTHGARSGERNANESLNERRSSSAVRDARPDPSRPVPGFSGPVGDHPQVRNAPAPDDDDRNSKIEQRIIDVLYEETGRYVTPNHAAKVRRQLLDGRDISNPLAYVAACIRGEPRSFMPAPGGSSNPLASLPEYPDLGERDNTAVNRRGRAAVEAAMRRRDERDDDTAEAS